MDKVVEEYLARSRSDLEVARDHQTRLTAHIEEVQRLNALIDTECNGRVKKVLEKELWRTMRHAMDQNWYVDPQYFVERIERLTKRIDWLEPKLVPAEA